MTIPKPYSQLTNREKLEFAAKAGGIPVSFMGNIAFTPYFDHPTSESWDPRKHADQAIDLMVRARLFGIGGDTTEETMQHIFDAAVYQGQWSMGSEG